MANYLLRLFDKHMAAAKAPAKAPPKLSRREQAFADYRDLLDNLPEEWTDAGFDRTRAAINALRVAGGNISHIDMPLPPDMVDWKNEQVMPGFSRYNGLTYIDFVRMLADFDARGETPPPAFMVAYRASKPAVPE